MADLVAQGWLDLAGVDPRVPDGLRARLHRWSESGGPDLPPAPPSGALTPASASGQHRPRRDTPRGRSQE